MFEILAGKCTGIANSPNTVRGIANVQGAGHSRAH